MPTRSKRHHFIPAFYLRHFANSKAQVRIYPTHCNKPFFSSSVKNAAVEAGFYTIVSDDSSKASVLETELAKIEAAAQHAIGHVLSGTPPSVEDRRDLALFMAIQYSRTPEQRSQHALMVDAIEKAFYENMTEEWARERLAQIGKEPTPDMVALVLDISKNPQKYLFRPHPNDFLAVMVRVAVEGLAPLLFGRHWVVGVSPGPALIAGDHPLVMTRHPAGSSHYRGGGLAAAEQLFFPIDRHHILILNRESVMAQRVVLTREEVGSLNRTTAEYSHRYVFQHPDDPVISALIPKTPRALMTVNLEPVFEVTPSAAIVLEPLFSPHLIRMPEDDELPSVPRLIPREDLIHFGTA